MYAYIYLLTTTFTTVFEFRYGFTPKTIGLVYIGLGLGSILGAGFFGYTSDYAFGKRTKAAIANGESLDVSAANKPEERLKLLLPVYGLIPVGLFIYGWTAYYRVHVRLLSPFIVLLQILHDIKRSTMLIPVHSGSSP